MNQVSLYAPPEYWKLTEEERRQFRCGPGRGILERLVPETVWGLCITPACGIHDFMYRTGEPTDQGKADADEVFLNNMIRLVEAGTKSYVLLWLRLRRAHTYYQAVRYFGGLAYWHDKNKLSEMGLVTM
jgi:hypothetical protein